MTVEEKIERAVDTLDPKDFEGFIKDAADNFYERLLYTVQDHLRRNAEYNLEMEISQARHNARHAEQRLTEISEALGVSPYSQEDRLNAITALRTAANKAAAEGGGE